MHGYFELSLRAFEDSLISNKTIVPSLDKIESLNNEFYRETNTLKATRKVFSSNTVDFRMLII